jgi:anthranilate synthase component 1
MKRFDIKTTQRSLLADTVTPVNIYLKVRDIFAGSILLESSDYHGQENSLSVICCDPISSFEVKGNVASIQYPDGSFESLTFSKKGAFIEHLETYRNRFQLDTGVSVKYMNGGLFGYMAYDAIPLFEDISFTISESFIPDVLYKFYRYIIVVDHFSNELTIYEHQVGASVGLGLDRLEQIIFSNRFATYPFAKDGEERSNFTDADFLKVIEKGKEHCYRGDVFQIVLSRRFECGFKGDEFNVYRALRSINPSPYLFYFDYGSFKLLGSSPEAQLQVKNGAAYIYPIAGTFRRSGNDQEDQALAEKLMADEKENAEHVMLVDLARNDMSRNAEQVHVDVFKEIQFYSHVIHLVSKVSGQVKSSASVVHMAADTFPAGTLSGAPKHMAMSLINKFENVNRGFYGGAIGFLGFDGSFNHAIMIRTFMSFENRLVYQAGAGVVAKSSAESELQEVNNKLAALRKALDLAEKI